MLDAWRLELGAWGLEALLVTLVQPIEKFLAALHIGRRERPMIICEPRQQVVVFNSLAHTSSSILPDQLYVSIVWILTSIETVPTRAALQSCIILFETSLSNCWAGRHTRIGWKPRVYLFHIDS